MPTPQEELAAAYKTVQPATTTSATSLDPKAELAAAYAKAQPATSTSDWQDRGQGFKTQPAVTHNGQQSFQREDSGVWYGPDQGNKGKPGWFDANGMRLGDAPGKDISWMDDKANTAVGMINHPVQTGLSLLARQSLLPGSNGVISGSPSINIGGQKIGYPTIGGVVKGAAEILPNLLQSSEHGIDKLTGAQSPAMTDAPVQAISDTSKQLGINDPVGEVVGQAIPFVASGGSSSAATVPEAINGTRTAISTLSSILKPLLKGTVKGSITGAIAAPALTGEANLDPNNPNDYANRKWDESKSGAITGGILGGAIEATPLIKKGYTSGKEAIKTATGMNNPLTTTGATLDDIVNTTGKDLNQIILGARGGKSEDIALVEQIRQAAAKEHGIDLTRANILDNPNVSLDAKDMISRRFSVGNEVHIEQGKQIKTAVQNILNDIYTNGTPAQEKIMEEAFARATQANKSPFNPQVFADTLKDNRNYSKIRKAFSDVKGPELNSILGLAEVIKSMPEAGKAAARLGVFEGMGPVRATAKVLSGIGALHTFGAAPALEMGGEAAFNRLKSNYLFKPKELRMTPNSSLAEILNPTPKVINTPVANPYFQRFINNGGSAPIVSSIEQLNKLPSGSVYQDANGTHGIKD